MTVTRRMERLSGRVMVNVAAVCSILRRVWLLAGLCWTIVDLWLLYVHRVGAD